MHIEERKDKRGRWRNKYPHFAPMALMAMCFLCASVRLTAARHFVGDKGTRQVYNITGNIQVIVHEDPFQFCFGNRHNGRVIFCSTETDAISAGRWIGANLQKYVYEGYALRIGEMIWWRTSQAVVQPVEYHPIGEESWSLRMNVTLGDRTRGGNSLSSMVMRALPLPMSLIRILSPEEHMTLEIKPAAENEHSSVALSVKAMSGNRVRMKTKSVRGEKLFGFGERFGRLNQRGQKLYCWTEDGGWSIGPWKRWPKGPQTTYFPVPFMLSSLGYGLWLNTTKRSDWDLDNNNRGDYKIQAEGKDFDVVIFDGENPAESLELYTRLSGRSLIPPTFQFGPWHGFRHNTLTQFEQAGILVDLDVPASVNDIGMHYLPMGVEQYRKKQLPTQTKNFTSIGMASLAYFNPMIDEEYSKVYKSAAKGGLFVNNQAGRPWDFYYKGAGLMPFKVGMVDFSNEEARKFYKGLLRNATDAGFSGWMYDYGEYVDPSMRFSNGKSGLGMHNEYPLWYQKTAFEYFTQPDEDSNIVPSRGKDYAPPYIFYVRSGYAGTAGRTWAVWTGDPTCDWDPDSGLGAQVKAMLSLGMSGVPFVGSDIGGFVWVNPPSLQLWVRWVQVGAASGIMRIQNGGTSIIGKKKTQIFESKKGIRIFRRWAKFRTALFPYLYTAAHEARFKGMPLMRHHLLTHGSDPHAHKQEYQWMLGGSLLCAPVVLPNRYSHKVYLPAGSMWYDLMSNLAYDESDGRHRIYGSDLLEGGQRVKVDASLDKMPMFALAGSVIPSVDPTVDTVNNATDSRITSLSEMDHLLHLWVFPDQDWNATGSTWDGFEMNLTQNSPAKNHELDLSVRASDEQNRNLLMQIAVGKEYRHIFSITSDGEKVLEKSTWSEVANDCSVNGSMSWFLDEYQRTLWLCMISHKSSAVYLHLGSLPSVLPLP